MKHQVPEQGQSMFMVVRSYYSLNRVLFFADREDIALAALAQEEPAVTSGVVSVLEVNVTRVVTTISKDKRSKR
jgi:hypothetical protein